MGLSGRNAVVTGGASGMGLAISQRLARDGASIAVFDVNREGGESLVKQLVAEGTSAVALDVDVSDRGQVDRAVEQVHEALGPVHVLVNSAGIARFEAFLEMSPDSWDRVIAVNLTGTFNCCQAMIGDMVEAGWGRIVNIASSGGVSGAARMSHYGSSKMGVVGLTKSLALEFGKSGVTVNCVPPGSIDTPMLRWSRELNNPGGGEPADQVAESGAMLPVGRIGQPEDIAAACAFFASEEASYLTGQVLHVNGGRYM